MSLTPPVPAPMPDPDDVSRGIAEIERYVAARTPALPAVPVPAMPAEGETKRVRELRATVAEAHRLVALQADDAPLLVDTPKVRKRRRKVAEAARLYTLAQDPDALAWQDARVRRVTTGMVMAGASIALAVSSIGVQASVATALTLDEHTIGWWAAFGVEPTLSLPLLAAVGVQAYAAMRGQMVDRKSPEGRKLLKIEGLLLGLTLLLNCWPAITWDDFDPLLLVVHSLGPVAAVAGVWLLPTLWAILGALPATRGTAGGTGSLIRANAAGETVGEYTPEAGRYTPERADVAALAARVRQLIAAGELPASPGIHKIRHALGCGVDVARRVQDALGGGA